MNSVRRGLNFFAGGTIAFVAFCSELQCFLRSFGFGGLVAYGRLDFIGVRIRGVVDILASRGSAALLSMKIFLKHFLPKTPHYFLGRWIVARQMGSRIGRSQAMRGGLVASNT